MAGQEKQGELLQLLLWNLNSTSNSPVAPRQLSCQISANQRKAEMSGSVNKHRKTRTKGNVIITNVISTDQHFSLTFSMQIFKFQRYSCKLSFLFPLCRQSTLESMPQANAIPSPELPCVDFVFQLLTTCSDFSCNGIKLR